MSEELVLVPQKPILPEKNRVWISGKLETDFEFSHQTYLEKFYTATVAIESSLGKIEHVVLYVSEQLLSFYPFDNYKNKYVEVGGELRRYQLECSKNHYKQCILFASTFVAYSNEDELEEANANFIFLEGAVITTPMLKTSRTGKDYTEFCLEVPRNNGKCDHVYCHVYSRTTLYATTFNYGTKIQVHGNLTTREYTKTFSDSSSVTFYDCKVAVHTLRKL